MRHYNLGSLFQTEIVTMRHINTHTLDLKDTWRERGENKCIFFLFFFLTLSVHSWVTRASCWLWMKIPLWWRIHAERENSELCSLNYPRLGEQVLILKMTEPDLVLQSPLPFSLCPKAQQEIWGTVQPPQGLGLALFQKIRKSSINHSHWSKYVVAKDTFYLLTGSNSMSYKEN